MTMSPTAVGTNWPDLHSEVIIDTNNPWRVETNFLGTNTSTTVAITLNGRTLNYIGGYGEDRRWWSGLPDGYEVLATLTDPYLPDTGMTGVLRTDIKILTVTAIPICKNITMAQTLTFSTHHLGPARIGGV